MCVVADTPAKALNVSSANGSGAAGYSSEGSASSESGRIFWPVGLDDDDDSEEEFEEGLTGLVQWPDHIPRSAASPGPGNAISSSIAFEQRRLEGATIRSSAAGLGLKERPGAAVSVRRPRRQHALFGGTTGSRSRAPAAYNGYASEVSTDLDDNASTGTFSSINSSDDEEDSLGKCRFSGAPSGAKKRNVISL